MVRVESIISGIAPRAFLGVLLSIRNRLLGFNPPQGTDLVGYESLLDWIKGNKIHTLDGDIVEIGSFMGGGTAKLARFFGSYGKKVYAVDIFDPSFDHTNNLSGDNMSSISLKFLNGRKQEDVFREMTRRYANIQVIKEDSKKVVLPCKEICFSFIDGCHDPDYVRNDFHLVWDKTVSGGVVGLHDYGGDLPQTTRTIDDLIEANRHSIERVSMIKEKWVILLKKK
jgi:hypothetical protein